MKILFVINKKEPQTLINELLNKLSEEKQDRINLERKLKEKEVEVL